MKVAWKINGIFNADANLVAEEINEIGSEYSCSQIVDAARDPRTELHKCFEWDDGIAAEKYRLTQAQLVIRSLVVVRDKPDGSAEKTNVRVIVNTGERKNTYKPFRLVVRDHDEYERLLETAREELRCFKEKYKMLSELEEIFKLID